MEKHIFFKVFILVIVLVPAYMRAMDVNKPSKQKEHGYEMSDDLKKFIAQCRGRKNEMFVQVIYKAQIAHLKELLNAGIEVNMCIDNCPDRTGLSYAVNLGHDEVVKELLAAGANVDAESWTDFNDAIKKDIQDRYQKYYKEGVLPTLQVILHGAMAEIKPCSVLPFPQAGGHVALFDLVHEYAGNYNGRNQGASCEQVNTMQAYERKKFLSGLGTSQQQESAGYNELFKLLLAVEAQLSSDTKRPLS
ncbi:MAG: hypothetical protein NTX86_01465 [Candidatus Dependentiae bacterium]|nr:hypothetical protein [Candidatus Dependentiae bacterium]